MQNRKKSKRKCPIVKLFKYTPMIAVLIIITFVACFAALLGKDRVTWSPP